MSRQLILASTSPFRRQLLENAGLSFVAQNSDVDERAVELSIGNVSPAELAIGLAEAKAVAVSLKNPDAVVIGCDQIMSCGSEVFHKSTSLADARRVLQSLRGREHVLNSGVVIAVGGHIAWHHVGLARMTMRPFSDRFLDYYMSVVDETVLRSVGGYQLEGLGIQLFEKVDGDYFTIIGLPMIELLNQLRRIGEIYE